MKLTRLQPKVIVVALVGLGYYILVTQFNIGLVRIFNYVTHLKCLGFGITHMIIHLTKLQFVEAFESNAFVFCGTPYYLLLQTFCKKNEKVYNIGSVLLGISCILFGILRNVYNF